MDVIVAIILMGLFSIAAGDTTSGQDYGSGSQVYIMNQYCTSQLGQTPTAVINETIAERFSGWEVKMEEKFTALKLSTNEEVKVMKNGVENRTKEYAASMEESFSKWKNLTELTMDEMKENLTNKGKEWQELKDQLDEMKSSHDSEMNKTSSFIAKGMKDLEEKIESKFASWRMEAESDMRRVKAWIEKRNDSFSAALTSTELHVLPTEDLTTSPTTETTTKDSFSAALTSTAPRVLSTKDLTTSPTTETTRKNSFSAALTSTAPRVLSTKDLTTSPTAETTTKVSCDITFNGICYWIHVGDEQNVNFARAEEICLSKISTPANFPSERVYNAVVEDVRSKMPSGRSYVWVWTGVTINTNIGNVIHPSRDTYVKWYPGYPYTGSSWKTYTHVALRVNSDPGSIYQGMFNAYPQSTRHGFVCQIVE